MGAQHPARHLLRARDLADARYARPLTVADLAREAGLSRAHFSREFRRAFGETPHQYLLTRRLERAAALLWHTDLPVTEICFAVGLSSVGSFTTSFRRVHGVTPSAYRAARPPAAARVPIPGCIARAYGRPPNRTVREAPATPGDRTLRHAPPPPAPEPHVSRSDGAPRARSVFTNTPDQEE